MTDTIFALSSGSPPSGVAVIRLSGPSAKRALAAIAGHVPSPRRMALRPLQNPTSGERIDRGLVCFFPGPHSFTGEDMVELFPHGSRSVVSELLDILGAQPGLRAADAGEFTRRAFINGRLDLTAAEGLADLLAAETREQRRQAMRMAEGALADRAIAWRSTLVDARALLEASIDFSEEEDLSDALKSGIAATFRLRQEMRQALEGGRNAERIRTGLKVAILGPPNAGKSSLLNMLASRPIAIVSDRPGTTRDVLEVHLDLDGFAVTVFDTAGLREADDEIEAEGVRRALERAAVADLRLWLDEAGGPPPATLDGLEGPTVSVRSKVDKLANGVVGQSVSDLGFPTGISVTEGIGVAELTAALARYASANSSTDAVLVNSRQRACVLEALQWIETLDERVAPEIAAEALRGASIAIGRLVGHVDVEEVLGAIFSRFCIGK